MAIKGYMESSLKTSEIFDGLSKSAEAEGGDTPSNRAINLIRNAKHLTNEDIEAAYVAVRQITDSLTRAAMKAFDEERIVLIYNDVPSQSVTQALPFITFNNKQQNRFVTYVFMDKYITINRDNVMTCQPPVLRDLLIGALISNGLKRDYNNLASNQYLQKILSEIYTKMVTRILNKEFSIAPDKVVFDVIQFWINKFFLTNIFGANDTAENIDTISSAHFKYVDEMKYEEIKRQYQDMSPHKFSELLNLVKTASPRMKALNLGLFLNDWMNYYYIPSTLAVDNIEYLIFMVIVLLSGNSIISVAASDIVKEAKNIKSLRGELIKLA